MRELADYPGKRPKLVEGGRSDASDLRRNEQDDVVIVGVVVDPTDPGRIGGAGVGECRQPTQPEQEQ